MTFNGIRQLIIKARMNHLGISRFHLQVSQIDATRTLKSAVHVAALEPINVAHGKVSMPDARC
jgi:hypothetical protein